MVKHFQDHPLFEPVLDDELADDPVVPMLSESTEEGKKVTRNKGEKFLAIYRRVDDPAKSPKT
jgi:tRNA (guanine-N7-)-methyltransferase